MTQNNKTMQTETDEFIPVLQGEINQQTMLLVDARLLHQQLESGQEFANWIKGRIDKYGFAQDIDFIVIHKFIIDETAFGGKRKVIDYYISIDMAKELAMVERNEQGKKARRYFIEKEKLARELLSARAARDNLIQAYRAQFLLEAPSEWVKLFPDNYYEALMKLHNQKFDRTKGTPMYCAQITREQIYNRIVPAELLPFLKSNNKKIHQWFSGGGRELLIKQIEAIRVIAKSSPSRVDFEQRCSVVFDDAPGVQLMVPFVLEAPTSILTH